MVVYNTEKYVKYVYIHTKTYAKDVKLNICNTYAIHFNLTGLTAPHPSSLGFG